MEITLVRQTETQVSVNCSGQSSHTFDITALLKAEVKDSPPRDPVSYGRVLYEAMFPPNSLARQMLDIKPGRILLVTTDEDLQTLPWEYLYDSGGFIVRDCHFVRGLPPDERVAPPSPKGGLHIAAVPSAPLDSSVPALDIDGEWQRLKELVQQTNRAITLERARPPTLEQLRQMIVDQQTVVVHFMGHGDQQGTRAVLFFENEHGGPQLVTAEDFLRHIRGNVFLVTLNACVSAAPGPTAFNNLALALVQQTIPYALGMRFSITDNDARVFSSVLYSELASGVAVEEAVRQSRIRLLESQFPWAIGVPVLYTSLNAPAVGFPQTEGIPRVDEHRHRMDVSALPRAEGALQGRTDLLKDIGKYLTVSNCPRVLTIRGIAGQGKTILAREAVERFAYAWPGGVWASSLENRPSREAFVNDLAGFLGVETEQMADLAKVERRVLGQLDQPRTLIVVDHAETLLEGEEQQDDRAVELTQFIREELLNVQVSILVTSRTPLEWENEVVLDLGGLTPDEGARLFWQNAPQRTEAIDPLARELSKKVDGHPLSLRLLGSAFNASDLPLHAFLERYEFELTAAEDKYLNEDHRHRKLYTSIETSMRYLDEDLLSLLSGLWIFQAPFTPQVVEGVFDPDGEYPEGTISPIYSQLYTLWQRGLLVREMSIIQDVHRDIHALLYRLPLPIRLFIEKYIEPRYERHELLKRFGEAYATIAALLHHQLNRNIGLVHVAQQSREDLNRGLMYVDGKIQVHYLLDWGKVLQHLGDTRQAFQYVEKALEITQGTDPLLESNALNDLAALYHATGHHKRALELFQRALPIVQELGNRESEAAILSNMGAIYVATGEPKQAVELFQRVIPIVHELRDQDDETSILNNMATAYRELRQPERALELLKQVLDLKRELGNRDLEAAVLNNMGLVHFDMGQYRQALALYEQALPISRQMGNRAEEARTFSLMAEAHIANEEWEQALNTAQQSLPLMQQVGNRSGEATVIRNMAYVYQSMRRLEQALALYQQALPILREVGNQSMETNVMNVMSEIYLMTDRPAQALEMLEQALPILRRLGNRSEEARAIGNMAVVYETMDRLEESVELFQQALSVTGGVDAKAEEAFPLAGIVLPLLKMGQNEKVLAIFQRLAEIAKQKGDPAFASTVLASTALLLQNHLHRPGEAITSMKQAIAVLEGAGLSKNANGITVDELQLHLTDMRTQAIADPTHGRAYVMPKEHLEEMTTITVFVMTQARERRGEWRADVEKLRQATLEKYGKRGQAIANFYTAVMSILDGHAPGLSEDHPYAMAVAEIEARIATSSATPLPQEQIQRAINNTVAVMTTNTDKQSEWREAVEGLYQNSQRTSRRYDAEFFTAILAILDGQAPTLPEGHLYAKAVAEIQEDIKAVVPLGPVSAIPATFAKAVLDFINADSWAATQQVLEKRWGLLGRAEAEAVLEEYIAQSAAKGQQVVVKVLKAYLTILRECKQSGIAPTFTKIIAVRDFVYAEDWNAKRQVTEAQQDVLLQPGLEFLIELMIIQLPTKFEKDKERLLETQLSILEACRNEGIAAVYERITQEEMDGSTSESGTAIIPDDFVENCVSGLIGTPSAKMAAFKYLQGFRSRDENFQKLIRVVQKALLGADMLTLGNDLADAYAALWQRILQEALRER